MLLLVLGRRCPTLVWLWLLACPAAGQVLTNLGTVSKVSSDSQGNVYVVYTSNSSVLYAAEYNSSGTNVYTVNLGSSSHASDMVIDSSGNIYVVYTNSSSVLYAAKYNASGTYQYAINLGSSSQSSSMTVDAAGNVYVVYTNSSSVLYAAKYNASGTYQYAINLGSSSHASSTIVDAAGNIYVVYTNSSSVLYAAKYNASGTYQFAINLGSSSQSYSMTVDTAGNVYVVYTNSSSVLYAAKYNASGTYQYAINLGSSSHASSMIVDAAGNIYVVYTNNSSVLYAAKYNASGTYQYAINLGSSSQSSSMTVDAAGNIYVVYTNSSSVLYAAKYNASGTYQYAINLGSSSHASSMIVDAAGNIYVVYTNSSSVLYAAKYNASGTYQYAINLGSGSRSLGMTIDAAGSIYLVYANSSSVLYAAKYTASGSYVYANALGAQAAISSLAPSSIAAGSASFSLVVNGSGFVSGSTVQWNGTDLPTSYVSPTQLNATVSANLVASQGSVSVTVVNQGAGASSSVPFTITAVTGPSITSLNPSSATAGGAAFTLTVNGSGFVSGAVVQWNGSALSTTFVSSTQLTATVSSGLIANAGTATITVASGGVTSAGVSFTIGSGPSITSLSPSSATVGGSGFTLTVNGSGFVSGAVVQWNGSALSTAFVSSTQLTATVSGGLIANAGTATITVVSGGATSAGVSFTIGSGPTISSLNPSSATAGGSGFTLTVTGSGFVSGAALQWNGSALSTTFVSSTQLTATVSSSLIANAGTATITVASGGATSAGVSFTIGSGPTISSLNPSSATAGGSGFTLTVTGSGFVSGAALQWNGSALSTTFVSSTQLTATVSSSLIANAGTATITVASGGATSAGVSFTIGSGPTISSLNPSSATAGGSGFTLTVTGSGFVSGAALQWNGSALSTTFVSSTQLTATVSSSLIANAGTATITVASGGVTSAGVSFTIGSGPTISSLNPSSATAGGSGFTLTVTGTGFVSGAVVQWNGSALTTTFVSSTQLTATVSSSLIANAGTASIAVVNQGGATSNTLQYAISSVGTTSLFSDDFTSSTLNSSWQILPGLGSYSVGGGRLRYYNAGPQASTTGWYSPALTLALPITGTNWVIETKATYSLGWCTSGTYTGPAVPNTSCSAGAQGPEVIVTFMPGTTPSSYGGTSYANTDFAVIERVVDAYYGSDSLSASYGTLSSNSFLNPADPGINNNIADGTYWYRITRNGGTLTIAYSYDGVNYTTGLSTTLANPSGTYNQLLLGGSTYLTNASYTDYSYVHITGTGTISTNNPSVLGLSPTSATAGGSAFTLTVNGSGFVSGSQVQWNGSGLTTTYVSATQLTAAVPANLIASAGSANITVVNPGGVVSNAAQYAVTALAITSLSPPCGGASTITINGTGFVQGSTAEWNGAALATTYVSAAQLTVSIPASLAANGGTASITVVNPGGTVSNALVFGGCAITSLSPTSATAGGPAFILTVNGTGLVQSSQVQWNGSALSTTYVNATQLTAAVPANLIANAGTATISVVNPGGVTVGPVSFPISVLNITSLSPNTIAAGNVGFTLTVTGTGFVATSNVLWNGSALTTTFVNATQLTASVPASLITTAGNVNVTVQNPGGVTSSPAVFAVNAPTITSLNPIAATTGGPAFTLAVNGTGFLANSAIQWNGAAQVTTFVSATQLTASIPPSLIATTGTANITVVNPGGAQSKAAPFVIAALNITSLTPGSASVGGSAFTLTVTGTGFVSTSAVQWNGSALATTFVSATQLTAAVPANLIATAGNATITIVNPGGGVSNTATFSVVGSINAIIPHFAAGDTYITGFYVTNTGTKTANFSLSFYDDNGKPVSVPFPSLATSSAPNPSLTVLSGTVAAQGANYYEAGDPNNPGLVSGSAVINADPSITVQALFRHLAPGSLYYEAAVPSSTGTTELEIAFDATTFAPNGSQIYTGIAIANLDPANSANVTCSARDTSGNLIANAVNVPVLNSLGHWAAFNFPALTGKRGTLDCTSNMKIGSIALRALGLDAISSLAVIDKTVAAAGPGGVPHFAAGSSYVTGFYVVNTANKSASFTFSFLDDNGKPIQIPFNGQSNVSTFTDTIPANGSNYYEAGLSQATTLQSGSVAVKGDPSITVQALFRHQTGTNTFYEAAVPSAPGNYEVEIAFDATTFAATRAQIYTGTAIANLDTSNSANVVCAARDNLGNAIPNALTIPALNPQGHWAGFNFPPLNGLRGTLDCTSNTKIGAIALRSLGTDAISSLPVILLSTGPANNGPTGGTASLTVTPANGSTASTTTPAITIAYSGINAQTLAITIDGVNVTSQFSIGATSATYSPLLTGGQHVITASAMSTAGALLQATADITVSAFQALPQAYPTTGPVPLTVTFVTNAIYTGGAITDYKWDFHGSGTWDNDNPGPQNYTYTYTTPGVYNAVLQVINGQAQTVSATVQITVTGAPPTVVAASVTPSDGAAPLAATFSATATASSGKIAKFEWDFNGDGIYDFSSTTTANTTYTYTTQGTYTAALRVTDSQGLMTIFSGSPTTVRVGAVGSPTSTIISPDSTLGPQSPPATIYFYGTGSSPNGTIVKYEWDFNGDGVYDYSSATDDIVNHTYNSPGTYTVFFRVTDSKGLTGVASLDIVITGSQISLSTDTLLPQQNGAVDVQTILSKPAAVTVFMKNQAGKTVRTLASNVQRTVGQYKDTWDGKDSNGNTVPDGVYYAIFQYTPAGGTAQTVDLTNTTGGNQITFDYTWTQNWTLTTVDGTDCTTYPGCSIAPYANNFMQLSFPMKQAAVMTGAIRLTNATTQVASLFTNVPLGQGPHVVYWEGTDAEGNVISPPPYDSFSPNIGGYSLPQNAVVVQQAPQISAVSANPNYLDPFTGNFLSGTGQPASISFTLSKPATVVLQVASADTGALLRTNTQPNVSAGNASISWDGRADNGYFAAPGSYRLGLKAVDSGGNQSMIRYVLMKVFY